MLVMANYINGKLSPSLSGEVIEVLNPYNQEVIGTVPKSTRSDVEEALKSSQKAQKKWCKLPAQKRASYLVEIADLLELHKEEMAVLLTKEHGKPLTQARDEIDASCGFIRYAAESARRIEGEIVTSEIDQEQTWIQRVPYGVTVGIVAWNFPLALAARKFGNSLVCGNTMIIKPPSETPLTVMRLAEIIEQESSLPAGVLNFITGSGSVVGDALVRNNIVKLVTLTGSTRAGLEVFRAAADHCVAVRLELGGKAPFIVMEDTDIDRAVKAAVIAKFNNCGQICTCNERMYIHESIYEKFVAGLIEKTSELVVGDPLNPDTFIGPKVNKAEVEKINQLVQKSVEQGGKVLLDMTPEMKPTQNGNWMYPVIIEVPNNDNILMHDEIFGPVLPVMKVRDFNQALEFANDSEYGLSAYLFTNNVKNIMRAVNELEFGEVYVNRENGEMINAFHNGYKLSGIGGEDGKHGLEGYLQKKTVYMNYQ